MAGCGLEPEILLGDNFANYQQKAAAIVREYVDTHYDPKFLERHNPSMPQGLKMGQLQYEVYIVWFAKALQNWKALVATTMEDHRYYEVTYNGDKKETYLDAYIKIDNVVIPD